MFTNVNKISYNITPYHMMSTKIFKSVQNFSSGVFGFGIIPLQRTNQRMKSVRLFA